MSIYLHLGCVGILATGFRPSLREQLLQTFHQMLNYSTFNAMPVAVVALMLFVVKVH